VNGNIFRVLQTSAAYFAGVSVTANHLLRYTIYAGMEVKEITLPSSPSVQNIIQAIPEFTVLEPRHLKKLIILPKWNYGKRVRSYYTRREQLTSFLVE